MEENNQVTNLGGNFGNIPPATPVQNMNNGTQAFTSAQVTSVAEPQYMSVPQNIMNQVMNNNNAQAAAQVVQPTNTYGQIPSHQQNVIQPQNLVQNVPEHQTNYTVPDVQTTVTKTNMGVQQNVIQPQIIPTAGLSQPVESIPQQPVEQPVKGNPKQLIEDKKPVEPITADNYIIRTDDLLSVLNDMSKVTVSNSGTILTETLQLLFTGEGLIINATDNINYITKKITSVKYNDEITLGVNIDSIKPVISKIMSEYLEIIPDYEHRTLKIKAGEDEFILPELYDSTTGTSISIDNPYVSNKEGIVVDYQLLKDKLNNAVIFMANSSTSKDLYAVYCGNIISATDGDMMYNTPNIPQLQNEVIYMDGKFVSKLLEINFEGEVTIILDKDEEGEVVSLTFKTDDTVFSGPTSPDINSYPVEAVASITNAQLDGTCTTNPQRILNAVDLLQIFINATDDKGLGVIDVISDGNKLKLYDKSDRSKQFIQLDNAIGIKDTTFKLNIKKLGDIVKKMQNKDIIDMYIGDKSVAGKNFIKLQQDDTTAILVMQDLT